MISNKCEEVCCEDLSLIENYDKAIADSKVKWVLHHRDEFKILPSGIEVWRSKEELKENNRYLHVPANELIFLTRSEHTKLHNRNPNSAFKNRNIQKELANRTRNSIPDLIGKNNPMFGKNAWDISCSRKTPEQIDATRKSKSIKMKRYWAERRIMEVTSDGSAL